MKARESVLFERLQHIAGHIARHGHHPGSHPGGQQQRDGQTENMKKWQQRQKNMLAVRRLLDEFHELSQIGHQIIMRQHGPLGHAGRSSGILENGDPFTRIFHLDTQPLPAAEQIGPGYNFPSIKRNGNPCSLTSGRKRLEPAQRKAQSVPNPGHITDIQIKPIQQRSQLGPKDIQRNEMFYPGIMNLMRQLGLHVQGIGHDRDGSRLDHAPEGDERLRQVGQHYGYPIPFSHTASAQCGSQPFSLNLQFQITDPRILKKNGVTLAVFGGGPVKHSGKAHFRNVNGMRDTFIITGEPGILGRILLAHVDPQCKEG